LERGDSYVLLDAYEYSERIISDFTDVIAELEERKRDLVREMEDQLLVQRASEAFFDFMENRFQPDLSVRLSADNVEKHRDQISQLIAGIRKRDKTFTANAERRLRELLPELAQEGQSVLWNILDGIDQRLRNASDIMLPALRKALQSFTKRADIIIRQMSYLASHSTTTCWRCASIWPACRKRNRMRCWSRPVNAWQCRKLRWSTRLRYGWRRHGNALLPVPRWMKARAMLIWTPAAIFIFSRCWTRRF